MSTYEFYNQNKYETYPFTNSPVFGSVAQPAWFVNAGVIFGPKSHWVRGDPVHLNYLTGNGSTSTTVRLSTAEMTFSFTFTPSNSDNETVWANSSLGAAYGIAYLTVGTINNLLQLNATLVPTNIEVVPANLQTLKNHVVTSINVANKYSSIYEDSQCGISYNVSSDYLVEYEGITGTVVFKPGRHILISTALDTNSLGFSTSDLVSSIGELPCRSPRVLPDNYSSNLEPSCADLLYTINGVGVDPQSNIFTLAGSQGVIITNEDSNTIKIRLSPSAIFGPITSTNCNAGDLSYFDLQTGEFMVTSQSLDYGYVF